MYLQRIELFHIAIPLAQPFETSFGVIADRPAIIVVARTDDGVSGYGEASPLYVPLSEPETLTDDMAYLKALAPQLLNRDIASPDRARSMVSAPFLPIAYTGIEGALYDIAAKQRHLSLAQLYGSSRVLITVGESIGIAPRIDDVLAAVDREVVAGYTRIKIKIKPGHDREVVAAVRSSFPSLQLAVDANAAYRADDIPLFEALDQYDILFIEQPFKADDYDAHAELQRRVNAAVCLDETVRDLATCRRAVEQKSCRMINIKPARVGGYTEAKAIHDYCLEHGIALFGGGRLETGIGKLHNAHFFSLPGFTHPADLTPPRNYFPADVLSIDFSVKKGVCTLPQGPGIGSAILPEVLTQYTQEYFDFSY